MSGERVQNFSAFVECYKVHNLIFCGMIQFLRRTGQHILSRIPRMKTMYRRVSFLLLIVTMLGLNGCGAGGINAKKLIPGIRIHR